MGAMFATAAPYKPDAGSHTVAVVKFDWQDGQRARAVPVKIYHPSSAKGPVPVIVFSHGLGGTRDAYEYLGRHWASHGYVSVHLQHPGSDDSAWRGVANPLQAMKTTAADWRQAVQRPKDVTFALDQLARLNAEDPVFKARLDLERVGMAGHSFGGWTTLASSGLGLGPGGGINLADRRIKAAISMSAPGTRLNPDKVYAGIRIPMYHLTGTEDDSIITDTKPEERRVPYDHINGADQYLLILEGGDHMIFSGRGMRKGAREKTNVFLELIRMSTIAFWDAYLKDDATARKWLAEGGFAEALGKNGVFEKKPGRPSEK